MDVFLLIIYYLINIVFVLSSIFLMLIILLQEGKGGGLSGAFGGVGTEAFGVKAGGINRFTAILAAIWLGSAILSSIIRPHTDMPPVGGVQPTTPVDQATPKPLRPSGTGQLPPSGGTEKSPDQAPPVQPGGSGQKR